MRVRCSQDPAEIIPNVFIGSVEVAKDADRLSKHGIEAVVNASKVVYNLPSSISLLRVEVEDSPDVNLACHFQKTSQFICEHVQRGVSLNSRTIVHQGPQEHLPGLHCTETMLRTVGMLRTVFACYCNSQLSAVILSLC